MLTNISRNIEGANIPVRTASGGVTKRIYFNNAATSLALRPVMDNVNTNVPLITYIDAPSPLGKRNTLIYENTRQVVLDYVGGDLNKDSVIYVKNSTEGINLLSNMLYQEDPGQVIITTMMEHMANYLPFKSKFNTVLVGIGGEGNLDMDDLVKKLDTYKGKVKLVAVTGASNVTGITPPIHEIARLAHKYGARILVDAVQLIQHQPFRMKSHDDDEHIDFLVFSAHKCYTPFDGGALIGPYKFFSLYKPFLEGAGITDFISSEKILYSDPPKRFEAGYPDIIGVMAMGDAFQHLKNIGLKNIAEYESKLHKHAKLRLTELSKVNIYVQNSKYVNVPFISFNLKGANYKRVSRYLGNEHGIEVGAGSLGADIYVQALLGVSPQEAYADYVNGNPAGLVRISLGMYNTFEEIDRFVNALGKIEVDNSYP
ncbi:MAG: pyridoxal phosphate-dependent transferase [Eubacterium sp.]|nr:pyridoxal phosphate-dependent transferase [Eubacterium sp.]